MIHVQRGILAALVSSPNWSTLELARKIYGLSDDGKPSYSQLKSLQQSLRTLRKKGLIVESDLYGRYGTRTWILNKAKAKRETRRSAQAKARAQQPRLIS